MTSLIWLKTMQNNVPIDKYSSQHTLIIAVVVSFVIHLLTGRGLTLIPTIPTEKKNAVVKMRIAEPVKPKLEEIPPPPPKKEKPKKQTPAPNQEIMPKTPTTEVPVQGVTKDSLSSAGTMAAPIGNTLMIEDTGKRLKDVEALRGDMSAPAKLISNTLKTPPYTDEALDAVLEGSFVVDVYVNLDGSVREAELRRKIGYGMDARVLNAVRTSKFIPRKNKIGVSEEGWTELKFTLVIP